MVLGIVRLDGPDICNLRIIWECQTELFNVVPACQECNSNKSDRLPIQAIFEMVKERNKKLLLQDDYTDDWYQKLYDSCLTTYHGNRSYFSRQNVQQWKCLNSAILVDRLRGSICFCNMGCNGYSACIFLSYSVDE